MILRILEYLSRIYRKQFTEMKQLYPIVPIVVYNGRDSWKEKNSFSTYMTELPDEIKKYLPDFQYVLIDIASYDDTLLEKLRDAVFFFFLLDKTDLTGKDKAADRILKILKTLEDYDQEIFKLLGRYITGLLQYRRLDINEINDYLTDRRNGMLAQSIEDLYEEGREDGLLTAKSEILIRQIEKKFSISDQEKELISSSKNLEKINDALDIILFASNAEEILSLFR